MIKILLLSLLMIKIVQFSIEEIFKIEVYKKIIYFILPIVILLFYVKLGFNEDFLRYSLLACFLLVISIIDYYTMYIYDITIISGIIIQGFILLITKDIIMNHILGLIFGFIIPYILVKLTKGIGSGDIGVYALCCFCVGINRCLFLIPMSFIFGSIYGVYLLVIKKEIKEIIYSICAMHIFSYSVFNC
ncbi:MAG: prepilin peptidase [Paeniclostridium sp.]|nr:prepilin peptidase [Paeniclostridium sp.]MBW4864417.1 prepilin peptidase [Paeniclostridium sp.]